MRVLILSRYTRIGASSRVRMYQYLPQLAAAGVSASCAPLLDDRYLSNLYARGKRNPLHLVRLYVRRLRAILQSSKYDLVWLEKECWPWLPSFIDPALLARRAPYVVDYDDAVFHTYDQSRHLLARSLYADKIAAVMRNARLVVAGNAYLAAHARAAGAPRIEIVPSVVDLNLYPETVPAERSGFTIGWIGSPATQHLLAPLAPVIEKVLSGAGDRLVTIGARFDQPLFEKHVQLNWDERTEVESIGLLDAGVMPLRDHPFERGKCGYKLIQYMARGLPVVASPVGVNSEIVQHGVNGFLASSPEQWREHLNQLRQDVRLRRSMGAAGRRRVEGAYCLQATGERMVNLLKSASLPSTGT